MPQGIGVHGYVWNLKKRIESDEIYALVKARAGQESQKEN